MARGKAETMCAQRRLTYTRNVKSQLIKVMTTLNRSRACLERCESESVSEFNYRAEIAAEDYKMMCLRYMQLWNKVRLIPTVKFVIPVCYHDLMLPYSGTIKRCLRIAARKRRAVAFLRSYSGLYSLVPRSANGDESEKERKLKCSRHFQQLRDNCKKAWRRKELNRPSNHSTIDAVIESIFSITGRSRMCGSSRYNNTEK
jgi:hypothetical protein